MNFVNFTCLQSPHNLVVVSVLKNCGCVHVYTLCRFYCCVVIWVKLLKKCSTSKRIEYLNLMAFFFSEVYKALSKHLVFSGIKMNEIFLL
jgi:hypothetical protein